MCGGKVSRRLSGFAGLVVIGPVQSAGQSRQNGACGDEPPDLHLALPSTLICTKLWPTFFPHQTEKPTTTTISGRRNWLMVRTQLNCVPVMVMRAVFRFLGAME